MRFRRALIHQLSLARQLSLMHTSFHVKLALVGIFKSTPCLPHAREWSGGLSTTL